MFVHPFKLSQKNNRKRAFILLFSLLISSVILTAGLAVTRIITRQIYLASVQRDSQMAFFAADAGLECGKYWKAKGNVGVAGGTCNEKELKDTGGIKITDFSGGDIVSGPIKTCFNLGGQEYVRSGSSGGSNPRTNEICAVVEIYNYGTVGALDGKIISRGYNVECDASCAPVGGRVVERSLLFRYVP
jgi:hypothetical protein